MDVISLTMENIRYNQGIKWNGSIQIRKTTKILWTHSGYTKIFLLGNAVSSEDKAFLMATPFRLYSGNEKTKSEMDPRGYMLCSMQRSGGINKPCVFLMSCSTQMWALSKIPSNPNIFPISSFFANMDHLFLESQSKYG